VPAAVPAVTLYTAVIIAVEPGATVGSVQETGPALGQAQVPPPVFTTATETNVVFAGVASVNVPVLQLLGPPLLTVCVYVMLFPAVTGFGSPLLVTVKSHLSTTGVLTVVLLLPRLGSVVTDDETEEFAVIVEAAVLTGTFTVTRMFTEALTARLESVHVTEVVVVQVQPAGADTETNVVPVGIASTKLTVEAAAGPLLVTVCV
jgi:hypothetical protein